MKKIALPLLILLASSAFAGSDFDLRRIRWGMSKSEVTASELPRTASNDAGDIIRYEERLFGLKATVSYFFFQERLFGILYDVRVPEADANRYYGEVKAVLDSKYGVRKAYYDMLTWAKTKPRDTQVNLYRNRSKPFHEIKILYTDRPLSAIEAPVVGAIKDQIKRVRQAAKKDDINNKL